MEFSISDETSNLELLFIASCYRQLSADINMKNYRLKPIFLLSRVQRPGLTKLVLIYNFILIFM